MIHTENTALTDKLFNLLKNSIAAKLVPIKATTITNKKFTALSTPRLDKKLKVIVSSNEDGKVHLFYVFKDGSCLFFIGYPEGHPCCEYDMPVEHLTYGQFRRKRYALDGFVRVWNYTDRQYEDEDIQEDDYCADELEML